MYFQGDSLPWSRRWCWEIDSPPWASSQDCLSILRTGFLVSPRPSDLKEHGRDSNTYYDLVSEVIYSHFHHILFIRRKLFWSAHIQEKEIRIYLLKGKLSRNLWKVKHHHNIEILFFCIFTCSLENFLS